MENLSVRGVVEMIRRRTEERMRRCPDVPEPRYDCSWCRDSGYVTCYREGRKSYALKFADVFEFRRERGNDLAMAPCGYCEAGTYRGRPTAGGLKAAELWVRKNVTSVVSLRGIQEKAEQAGYDKEVIKQAFKRVGIVTYKAAGRLMCEPAA